MNLAAGTRILKWYFEKHRNFDKISEFYKKNLEVFKENPDGVLKKPYRIKL